MQTPINWSSRPSLLLKIATILPSSKINLIAIFTALIIIGLSPQSVVAQTITICSQDAGSYNINGSGGFDVRSKLSNMANFGPAGAICEFQFEYVTVGNNFTEATLNANGCEIWWSGFEVDGSYSASETTEILNWIGNGGLVIAGCDAPNYDPLCEILNLELSGFPSGSAGVSTLNVDLTDNCFPNTAAIPVANGGGALDAFSEATSSQYRVITRLESNINNVTELNGLATTIYGDGIFATSDVNMFTGLGCCLTDGPELTNSNDFFMGEAICVLSRAANGQGNCIEESIPDPRIVVPTMSQWALFILALIMSNLALVHIRQKQLI